MDSKIILYLIIGTVVGGSIGYGVTNFILTPQLNEIQSSYNALELQYGALTMGHETLLGEHSALSEEFEELSEIYQKFTKDHDSLTQDYNSLTENYFELNSSYNQVQTSYNDLLNDYELLVAALPPSQAPISAETIEKEYEWYFRGQQWTLSLSIPETQYEYYQKKDRVPTEDYSVYVTHPFDDEYINTIIKKFSFIALTEDLTEAEKIDLVISFVQSLPYTSDTVTTPHDEYPRYPLETLVDNGGDCEDTSILTASLLEALYFDVILIAPPEHMAVGVNIDAYGTYYTLNEKKYFFLETTGEGWEIGEVPSDFIDESAYLYELKPIPICIHDWNAKWLGTRKIEVIITASNVGTAMAYDIFLYASFDAGEDYIWNEEISDSFDLNIGNNVTITLVLDVPRNEHTRLIVGVVDSEGYMIDESYSSWFDT